MSDFRDSLPITAVRGGYAQVGIDGRFQKVDPALAQLLGYTASELLCLRFHDITHHDDLLRDEAQFERVLAQGCGAYSILKRYFTAAGDVVWAELNAQLFCKRSGDPLHFVSRVRPTQTERGVLERLHACAVYDPLTGLLNRGQLDEQLVCAERKTRRTGQRFAVLSVDLDGFKMINDTHGHATGDDILRAFGRRLALTLDPEDIAGRVGGDEFLVLLRDIDTPAGLERKRARLQACLARPFEVSGGPVHLAASVGTGVYPDDAGSISGLIAFADAGMYRAKRRRFTAPERSDRN